MRIFKLSILFLVSQSLFCEIILESSIWNATRSIPVEAEKIEIIELTDEGMKPLITLDQPKKNFQTSIPQKPILIRVQYQGETYIEFVNNEELKKNQIQKKITVYDKTTEIKNLVIHSGFQVTKYSENLEIHMIYAIQNKTIPPRTISSDEIIFSIPENATILNATLTHSLSQIPVRVNLIKTENNFYKIDKSIKPGNSELIIQIEVPNFILKNQIDPILLKLNPQKEIFRVFMWKPEDIQPIINGGKFEEKQVPNLGKAYFVYYMEPTISIDFSKGSVLFKNPLKAYTNPIFDKSYKTISGIVLGIFIIFLIIPIISTSSIRIKNVKT